MRSRAVLPSIRAILLGTLLPGLVLVGCTSAEARVVGRYSTPDSSLVIDLARGGTARWTSDGEGVSRGLHSRRYSLRGDTAEIILQGDTTSSRGRAGLVVMRLVVHGDSATGTMLFAEGAARSDPISLARSSP